jgi:hypothetical protein
MTNANAVSGPLQSPRERETERERDRQTEREVLLTIKKWPKVGKHKEREKERESERALKYMTMKVQIRAHTTLYSSCAGSAVRHSRTKSKRQVLSSYAAS